jgi:hypothetical protein
MVAFGMVALNTLHGQKQIPTFGAPKSKQIAHAIPIQISDLIALAGRQSGFGSTKIPTKPLRASRSS